MENRRNKYGKQMCVCCQFYTITEIKETCPVCFWDEDVYQEENIDDNGGPNTISLRIARENFKEWGVIEKRFKDYVRPPQEDELP